MNELNDEDGDRVEAGYELILDIRGETNETVTITLTEEDVNRGYAEYTFSEELLKRLLDGLTVGSEIEITPTITNGDEEVSGETVTIEITQGLLNNLLTLVDDLLDGGNDDLALVTPVVSLLDGTVSDLAYILSGKKPIRVELQGDDDVKVEADYELI
ncbi:hypothetical protein [Desertibacillus haloalkaliphilus]|uniref:hypothetical protein n=1 Tax=Desertibacillus haloalkaliphilus TaxID=1328930 RepID=UPI001C264EF8|nr:hypothetical protein [Desertibacillus haloalkaliphilus]MBU8905941.1 hypothetical protein [Desertibacillus haloalkaliphilus]